MVPCLSLSLLDLWQVLRLFNQSRQDGCQASLSMYNTSLLALAKSGEYEVSVLSLPFLDFHAVTLHCRDAAYCQLQQSLASSVHRL